MPAFGSETVNLARANGRVLRQTVNAERDQPPFDRVTMDAIAIAWSGFEAGNRVFAIQGRQHAGENFADLLRQREAGRAPPIQMCDAKSGNTPKDAAVIVSYCNRFTHYLPP